MDIYISEGIENANRDHSPSKRMSYVSYTEAWIFLGDATTCRQSDYYYFVAQPQAAVI
jgi:hypothetical protein